MGAMRMRWAAIAFGVVGLGVQAAAAQERLPVSVAGTWKIVRVLPVRSASACWGEKDVAPLVGSTLEYSQRAMRWQGGTVPLTGVTTRTVSSADLAEGKGDEGKVSLTLTDLGFLSPHVTEVNLQHEDADITGATTEVPGDSVLVAGPGRIVVSACGVYLEARRVGPRQAPVTTASSAAVAGGKGL